MNKWINAGQTFPLPTGYSSLFACGDYLYSVGGYTPDFGSFIDGIYACKINADGTMGKWELVGRISYPAQPDFFLFDQQNNIAFFYGSINASGYGFLAIKVISPKKVVVNLYPMPADYALPAGTNMVVDGHGNLFAWGGGGSSNPTTCYRFSYDMQSGALKSRTKMPGQPAVNSSEPVLDKGRIVELEHFVSSASSLNQNKAPLGSDGSIGAFRRQNRLKTPAEGLGGSGSGSGKSVSLGNGKYFQYPLTTSPGNVNRGAVIFELDASGNVAKSFFPEVGPGFIGVGGSLVCSTSKFAIGVSYDNYIWTLKL